MRRYSIVVLAGILPILASCGGAKTEPASVRPEDGAQTAIVLDVYYFHRTIRCPSCNKIEELTRMAVEQGFAGDLAAGGMRWHVINVDEAPHKHFEKDYQLAAQSVVLSEKNGGKETRWKTLGKVWDLLSEDTEYVRYIQDEIRAFAQGN